MPAQSSSPPSRNDFTAVAWHHPLKLKSWLTQVFASDPMPFNRHQPHARTHFQLLSNLPLELRRQIYTHVLDSYGTAQHIFLSDHKLIRRRCTSSLSHTYFQTQHARTGICELYKTAYRESVQSGWEIMPLLLSCRKIYLEFIELIYSSVTFHLPIDAATQLFVIIPDPHITLARFHLMVAITEPMYLPPHAWPLGFTVKNSNPQAEEAKWEAYWCTFAHLRVRALIVEILSCRVKVPEQTLLEPLRNVRARDFEVVLPWPTGLETTGDFEDAEFVVRRPQEGTDLMIRVDVDKGHPGPPKPRVGVWERLRRR